MTKLNSGYYLRKIINSKTPVDFGVECINLMLFYSQRFYVIHDMLVESAQDKNRELSDAAFDLWKDTITV